MKRQYKPDAMIGLYNKLVMLSAPTMTDYQRLRLVADCFEKLADMDKRNRPKTKREKRRLLWQQKRA